MELTQGNDKAERGCIVGQTGTGKSYLAARLLPRDKPLCIIDPKRSFGYAAQVYDSPAAIWRSKPERFIYRPKPVFFRDLQAYDEVYRYCYERGPKMRGGILVYTDDIVGVVHELRPPAYLQMVYQMGRGLGIASLSCCQRPARVPRFMTSEVEKSYCFRVRLRDDVKRINEDCCPGYDPDLLLSKHHFFYYDVYRMDVAQQTIIRDRQ